MTVVEILTTARAHVAAGWVQGRMKLETYSAEPPCYCAVGAVYACGVADREGEDDAIHLLHCACHEHDRTLHNVIAFNDAPGRTQADVLAVYDTAINMAHSLEGTIPV